LKPPHLIRLTFGLLGVFTILSLRYPPRLGSDFLHMQRAWDHWMASAEFNRLPLINSDDIAKPASEFVTWWSPGGELLIGLATICGLNLGQSLTLWLGLTAGVATWGTIRLYRRLGIEDRFAGWAVLLGTVSYWGLYNFRQVQGADIFAHALTPWLFLGLLATGARPPLAAALLATVALIGALTKLSFFITAAAALFAAVLGTMAGPAWSRTNLRRGFALGAWLAGGLAGAWWALHASFLAKGASPASAWATQYPLGAVMHAAAMASLLPFSGISSFVSISNNLCTFLGWPHLHENVPLILVTLVVALITYAGIWRAITARSYRAWALGIFLGYAAAFGYLFLSRSAVGYDDRYFRAVAMLLLPGMVACAYQRKEPVPRILAVSILTIGTCWGINSYIFRIWEISRHHQTSDRGYSLAVMPESVESAVRGLDADPAAKGLIFCSPENEVLLAVRRNRPVRLENPASPAPLRGRGTGVVLILPPGIEFSAVQSRFRDFQLQEWKQHTLGGWIIARTIRLN
jgi:hypothetical protein